MSTDRELLEAAAKAAGIKDFRIDGEGYVWADELPDASSGAWSPLHDDGDAFRLALQVGLCIVLADGHAGAGRYDSDAQGLSVHEAAASSTRTYDRARAMRRAITKAAAEIWAVKGDASA